MKKATCPNCKTKLTTSPVDPFGRLFCPTCKYLGEVTLTPDPELGQKAKRIEEARKAREARVQEFTQIAGRVRNRPVAASRPGMSYVWKQVAFSDYPDALRKCCAPFLNDAGMARLPKNADEKLLFEEVYENAVGLDAARGRKQQANQKTISPLGGFAAAVNKDDDIFRVLREYKRAHPWHKMTAACEKTVAARLLDYSNRAKLLARLSRIGKRMNPVKSPSQIYAEL
jgi:uncharacterized Zn finger protein (UPF0148 family)